MIEQKAANAIRSLSTISAEDALRHAIGRLVKLGTPDDLEAAVWLQDIVEQHGMLDYACENDRLVEAIDVFVRG